MVRKEKLIRLTSYKKLDDKVFETVKLNERT